MYFYALKKTKEKFATTGFSERESLPYLLVFVTLISITALPYTSQNFWDYTTTALSTIIGFVATILLYRANGGADGRQFISKYIILGWVLIVRGITFLIVPFAILLGVGYWLGYVDLDSTQPFDVISSMIFEIALYVYLYMHFSDLRKMERAEQDAAANP